MSLLHLVYYPSPFLRKTSAPVLHYDFKNFKTLIEDMAETMAHHNGIGLAAPQIGKNIRLVMIKTQEGILTLINPEIIKSSRKKETSEEGCLSIPGTFGLVERSMTIKISALLSNGKKIIFHGDGLFSRVIQHEIDHINGILFIDRTSRITRGKELLEEYASKV